ncbi:MAG: DNA polymerase III subunit beta, partial [Erysipelotrichaceae bacterium]|nr:DNA polymerase III subunit beta [Erysipelotrichaceae bacterium]
VYDTGSIVINKNYIIDIVRKIESEVVEVEIMDGSLTKISGGTAEFNINGIKASEYPLIDFNKQPMEFTIDAKLLKSIVNQTAFATSTQETRMSLTGINFKCDGSTLECTATDSFRLAKKVVEMDCPLSFNITIPAKSIVEVSRNIDDEQTVTVSMSEKKAQFIYGGTIMQTRLIDGAYPETNRLIPQEFSYELTIGIKDVINAIDRQSFIKNETDQFSIVKLSMSEEETTISSRSQEVGFSVETLNVETYSGDKLDISFSGKYMMDALKGLNGEKVHMCFCGVMKPIVLKSLEDESCLQLVLPVRTYN